MTDQLPFETYKSVAKEIAERNGNLTLVNIILKTYLDVAQTYSFYPIDSSEKLKVIEAYKELEQIASEHNKKSREIELKLEEHLKNTIVGN
mgnify:CR=1 FL=1